MGDHRSPLRFHLIGSSHLAELLHAYSLLRGTLVLIRSPLNLVGTSSYLSQRIPSNQINTSYNDRVDRSGRTSLLH